MELRPEAVALAKRLHRASPKTGKRMSLRKIAATLAEAGHLNERGKPFNPKSIVAIAEDVKKRPCEPPLITLAHPCRFDERLRACSAERQFEPVSQEALG